MLGMAERDMLRFESIFDLGRALMRLPHCPNLNHRRTAAPVRYCPHCGEVVNKKIFPQISCAGTHIRRRRERNKFCVDCGLQLIT